MKKVIFAISIIVSILLLIILVFFLNVSFSVPMAKFDKQIWIKDLKKQNQMANYLIENKLLIGKTKEEVIDMLGSNYSIKYYPYRMVYLVGMNENYMSVDPDMLEIYFENNMVTKVEKGES